MGLAALVQPPLEDHEAAEGAADLILALENVSVTQLGADWMVTTFDARHGARVQVLTAPNEEPRSYSPAVVRLAMQTIRFDPPWGPRICALILTLLDRKASQAERLGGLV